MVKVLLIGDKLIDQYLYADPVKMSEEAPVIVLRKTKKELRPGGADNVKINLEKLGAEVTAFFGKKRPSLKVRVVSGKQQIVRVDDDNFQEVEPPEDLEQMVSGCDVIAVADYNKGVVNYALMNKVQKYAQKHNKKIFVDPYKDKCNYGKVELIKPNKGEAESVTGVKIVDDESLIEAGKKYLEISQANNVIITMGSKGMALFDRKTYQEKPFVSPVIPMELKDITGAGDTVFAVLVYIWSQPHFSKSTSLMYANKAASISCSHFGTYAVSHAELFEDNFPRPKITDVKRILNETIGKKVVMANGCFDLLHIGHFNTLKQAKTFGDILVVALNTDESVKQLKGPNRPVFAQLYRAQVMAELPYVDYVVFFDDMEAILNELKPDVVVKGDETWKDKDTPEKRYAEKYNKKVEFVKQLPEEKLCKERIDALRSGLLKDMGASGLRSSYHAAERPRPSLFNMETKLDQGSIELWTK